MMIDRHFLLTLTQRLQESPAVVLLGPRQVGKTTLALQVAEHWPAGSIYLDLERPADRLRLDDADAFLRTQGSKLVILDEIHRMPGLFDILRGIIDERRRDGQRFGHFLLLGSASLDLMQQSSETLAGRVAYVDLGPIQALEWESTALDTLWLRGGFPDSLLASDDAASLRWREDFVRSYLQRDVPMFAPRLPAETVGRLWTMLAHQQGAFLQQSRLASGLGVSSPTLERYIDLLVDLQLVRRLRPWSVNTGKRLVKAPKVYVRDSGLVHALLGLETVHDLAGHPVCGLSYEGFCIDNLLAATQAARSRSAGVGSGGVSNASALLPQQMGQLQWLGVRAETVAALAHFVTILPESTPVNLNTASAEVIYASVGGLDLSSAQKFVQARGQSHFDNLTDTAKALGVKSLDSGQFSVSSRYFEVWGRLRLEDRTQEETALIWRRWGRFFEHDPLLP
jgi:predicted AAA+ superfamily ATPase